jgi:hypothetical protein
LAAGGGPLASADETVENPEPDGRISEFEFFEFCILLRCERRKKIHTQSAR